MDFLSSSWGDADPPRGTSTKPERPVSVATWRAPGDRSGSSSAARSASRSTARRRERELPGRLGRILLGYLALNRRRAVPRDELIGALWPDTPPGDPGATLSNLLSGLRRTLGADVVRGRGQLTLTLPPDTRLDVEEAREDLRQGRAERALEVLERILLPGFEAPWLDERRRELEDERLTALELVSRDALARGDAHRAHWAARRLVALGPWGGTAGAATLAS